MSSSGGLKYFLYIPVWATTQQPASSGSSSLSSSQSPSSSESGSPASPSSTETYSSSPSGSSGSQVSSSGVPSSSSQSTEGTPSESSGGSGASSGGSGASSGSGGSVPSSGSGASSPSLSSSSSSSSGSSSSASESLSMTGQSSSGSVSSSGNCLLFGTLVTLADGRRVPIEVLSPGDEVRSLLVPGLKTDVPFRAQYEWLSTWGLDGATVRAARVSEVRLGEHNGFCLINRRIKATFEHPFLVRRGDAWGFCSAELLQTGDQLIVERDGTLAEEKVASLERIEGRVRTVAIRVPGTNTYIADGTWTHNDGGDSLGATPGISASGSTGISQNTASTSAASSSSSSSSSKSSGSSFSSSSGTIDPTMQSSSG